MYAKFFPETGGWKALRRLCVTVVLIILKWILAF
jgi:hypothetical protein